MEFTIRRRVRAPPEFVATWWLSRGPGRDDPAPTLRRTSERLPTGQTRIVTDGTLGSRRVRHDGVLTVEGAAHWSYRTEVWSNDQLIVREQVTSEVRAEGDGAWLTSRFEVVPVGRFHRFVFWTGSGGLRRQREAAYDRYIAELERDFGADRPAG